MRNSIENPPKLYGCYLLEFVGSSSKSESGVDMCEVVGDIIVKQRRSNSFC